MDESQARFAPGDDVVSEVIDGEAIIIKLSDGTYYSIDGAGALIWELLGGRLSVGEIGERVVLRYEVTPERAHADVAGLVADLCREQLIGAADLGTTGETPPEPEPRAKLSYQSPELHCYRDMADLLALDPPTPGVLDHLMRGSRGLARP